MAEAIKWARTGKLKVDHNLSTKGVAMNLGPARTLIASQMEKEAQAIAATAGSADFQEGVLAFLQKRAPKFTGD